jgi:EAL domain-containing protein (putative c-di-GMP-specific phosphodiesterase class I)
VLGHVPPGRFIPIAEALGMMPEIGNWVLHEACRQARVWLDAGHSGFTIAVNISPQQLRRPGLHRTVDEALRKFGVPGNTLEIELTESTALENVARVRHELDQLKALGAVLTLDDFGTGHSSLAYLKQFAMDKLKIDQTFVQGLPDNPLDASISRGILAMGRDLGLRVAAEGVETTQQAVFLRDLGCDELQGYLMGEPAPAAAAERYFDALDAGGNGRPAAVAAPLPGSG